MMRYYAIFVGVLSFLSPVYAFGAPNRHESIARLWRDSDIIAVGTIEMVHTIEGRSGIEREVTLRIEQTILGSTENTVRFSSHGGTLGRRTRVVHGQAEFVEGERVLVFLRSASNGQLWPVGMALGRWVAGPDARCEFRASDERLGGVCVSLRDLTTLPGAR